LNVRVAPTQAMHRDISFEVATWANVSCANAR
jgi:hypothetical protein